MIKLIENKKKVVCKICQKKSEFIFLKKKQPTKIYPSRKLSNFKKRDLNIYFCKQCSYCFQHPMPNDKMIDKFYKDEDSDISNYTSLIKNPSIGSLKEKEKIDFIINSVKKYFKTKKSINIAEVGGFDGYALYKLSKIFKVKKKILIEPNKLGSNIAKSKGITVNNSYLDENLVNRYKGNFDLVICKHVIEHVKDYKKFSSNLTRILSSNGILIIETPDLNMIFKKGLTRVFILQHLNYFSIISLKKIFEKLSILKFKTTSQENSIIIAFKNGHNKNKKINLKMNKNSFKKKLRKDINSLNKFCKNNKDKKIWIYGASSLITDIFTLYNVKKECIAGIIDTDKKKISMRMPVQNDLPILFYKDKKISKKDAVIITTAAKLEVTKLLNKNSFRGPRFFLQ